MATRRKSKVRSLPARRIPRTAPSAYRRRAALRVPRPRDAPDPTTGEQAQDEPGVQEVVVIQPGAHQPFVWPGSPRPAYAYDTSWFSAPTERWTEPEPEPPVRRRSSRAFVLLAVALVAAAVLSWYLQQRP
jgi:hypothetical protein